MMWMVHRAWLNDPTLTVLDFTNLHMPLPNEEPRVAPKLMEALHRNTHIKSLLLSHSNFRNPQALEMADALRVNTSLEVVNIEGNWVDPDGALEIAHSLTDNQVSNVH